MQGPTTEDGKDNTMSANLPCGSAQISPSTSPLVGEGRGEGETAFPRGERGVQSREEAPENRDQLLAGITELHALTRRGLWGILLFLTLSAAALYLNQAGIFALVPAEIKETIGEPPPAHWLHIVLAISWLSAFVLILGRMVDDGKPSFNWYNIGLPTVFYPLYIFSDAAERYFPVVFAAGLILLLAEHASVIFHARRLLREETARLRHLNHLRN